MYVATKHLKQEITVGVLGAGFQATHHTFTWAATRPVGRFQIWARRLSQAQELAETLEAQTGVPSEASMSAEKAVTGADAVLGVTASPKPVVDFAALPHDAYIATVGPKFGGRHEDARRALRRAALPLHGTRPTSAPPSRRPRGPLPGGRKVAGMTALSDIVCGRAAVPPKGQRLFVSEGLAGSEVALLGALLP